MIAETDRAVAETDLAVAETDRAVAETAGANLLCAGVVHKWPLGQIGALGGLNRPWKRFFGFFLRNLRNFWESSKFLKTVDC